MSKNTIVENGPINTITKGTVVKGNVQANGDFRMDGTIVGNVTLNGKLVIGETGVIQGNVICQNANVIGTIQGNISVKEQLTLHATASVKGDIMIGKLSIEPGASFSGTCKMLDEVRRENAQQSEATNQKENK